MFAVILVPDFSLQAVLRQEPDLPSRPVALVDPALPKPNIVQLTAAARERGVVEGLTPSQAMARCGNLTIRTRSPAQEAAATDILLQTAYAFSPGIESTKPGVCTMDLKGLVFETAAVTAEGTPPGGAGGEAGATRWAGEIFRALAELGLHAQIGMAATPALALLAAHAVKQPPARIVRDSAEFVSALPVAALEPSPEILGILERWGIQTVGSLLALGKSALAERLGLEAISLLDRVSPHSRRPLKLVVPRETYEERMEFENEIETVGPLLFVLRRFVEQLARRLEVIHLVVAELQLRLKLGSGAVYEHQFNIPAATSNVETLFRMLQTHLETVRTESPIASLQLEARPCKPQTHQFGLFETTLKDPNQFAETLARLTALCGPDRVGTPVLESTHRPDAFRMKAPEFDERGHAPSRRADLEIGDTSRPPQSFYGGWTGLETCATGLQLRRFRPAVPALIEFRDRRPSLVRSAVVNGTIADLRGPFVSSGDWWDAHPWQREEWDAQAGDGTLYRIFRSPEGCFVEGVYD